MHMLCNAQGIGVESEPDAMLSPVESFDPGAVAKGAVTSLGVDLRCRWVT